MREHRDCRARRQLFRATECAEFQAISQLEQIAVAAPSSSSSSSRRRRRDLPSRLPDSAKSLVRSCARVTLRSASVEKIRYFCPGKRNTENGSREIRSRREKRQTHRERGEGAQCENLPPTLVTFGLLVRVIYLRSGNRTTSNVSRYDIFCLSGGRLSPRRITRSGKVNPREREMQHHRGRADHIFSRRAVLADQVDFANQRLHRNAGSG